MDSLEKTDQFFLRRMEDLMERADQIGYPVFSDFLDGHQRAVLHRFFVSGCTQVHMACFGGYKDAERVIAAFYPSFLSFQTSCGLPDPEYESPIAVIRVEIDHPKFLKRELMHRDYLGSLMALGIKRELIGDILTNQTGADLIVLSTIEPYILESLVSVGSSTVSTHPASFSEIARDESDGEEMVIQLNSIRLDALISHTFNLSRDQGSQLIRSGRVQVNWQEVLKTDYQPEQEDVISVRGSGRIRVCGTSGMTRSGKIRLKIIRYR